MRTPETHYFEHGFIKFFKYKGKDYFTVYFYDTEGVELFSVHTGKVVDQEHVKQLTSVTTMKEMKQQILGSVKT